MAIKFLFLLALVALAYGIPAPETTEVSESAVGDAVPASVAQYLDQLVAGDESGEVILEPLEPQSSRQKRSPRQRVCRRVLIRRKRKNIPKWECH